MWKFLQTKMYIKLEILKYITARQIYLQNPSSTGSSERWNGEYRSMNLRKYYVIYISYNRQTKPKIVSSLKINLRRKRLNMLKAEFKDNSSTRCKTIHQLDAAEHFSFRVMQEKLSTAYLKHRSLAIMRQGDLQKLQPVCSQPSHRSWDANQILVSTKQF